MNNNGDNRIQIMQYTDSNAVLTAILCDIHGISFQVSAYGSLKTKEKSKS